MAWHKQRGPASLQAPPVFHIAENTGIGEDGNLVEYPVATVHCEGEDTTRKIVGADEMYEALSRIHSISKVYGDEPHSTYDVKRLLERVRNRAQLALERVYPEYWKVEGKLEKMGVIETRDAIRPSERQE